MIGIENNLNTLRNEGEQAFFQISKSCSLRIQSGNLAKEIADAVLVPTNAEFISSGALDFVFQLVQHSSKLPIGNVEKLLFGVEVKDKPSYHGREVYFDDLVRPALGQLGDTLISAALDQVQINLPQKWRYVMTALIRHQSMPPDYAETLTEDSVTNSINNALLKMTQLQLKSLVMVPFGTGLGGINAEDSAKFMLSAIKNYLETHSHQTLQKITVVESCPGNYLSFSSTAKNIFSSGRYDLTAESM